MGVLSAMRLSQVRHGSFVPHGGWGGAPFPGGVPSLVLYAPKPMRFVGGIICCS